MILGLELQMFHDKKDDFFDAHVHTHTHTHTHTRHTQMHNLKFSVDHQPQPPLLMFQFDSHQILLRLLLHFILLVHQLFF